MRKALEYKMVSCHVQQAHTTRSSKESMDVRYGGFPSISPCESSDLASLVGSLFSGKVSSTDLAKSASEPCGFSLIMQSSQCGTSDYSCARLDVFRRV
jgi:hypothetical protein